MNMLLELRERAKSCPDVLQRRLMKDLADLLQDAIKNFAYIPSDTSLQNVNGLWARGVRLLELNKPADPSGSGGAFREGARLAA